MGEGRWVAPRLLFLLVNRPCLKRQNSLDIVRIPSIEVPMVPNCHRTETIWHQVIMGIDLHKFYAKAAVQAAALA